MIQSTGVIPAQDGVSEYKDLVINIYSVDASKFVPVLGVAQVGIFTEATEHTKASFSPVAQIGTYEYVSSDPAFSGIQEAVLAGLQKDYQTVTFEIVK